MAYTKQEKLTRCKLAAVYRLIDMYGWTQGIYNHVTVRIILASNSFRVTLQTFGSLQSKSTIA